MTMLIDDRPPPEPPPEQRAWEPDWTVVGWLAVAIVVGFAAFHAHGALGMLLIFVAFGAACRALAVALPDGGGGLREWRQ